MDPTELDLDKVMEDMERSYEEYNRTLDNYYKNKNHLEYCRKKYLDYCSQFSQAYLSGSLLYILVNECGGFDNFYFYYCC